MIDVVPLWFWIAVLLATLAMGPTMVQRWRSLRAIRIDRPTTFDALYLIVSRLWLPAVALAVPAVYVIRLLVF
ncbi:MAG: hypothetical protein L6R19_23780 [Alphaproteobacteria bacterium]|nr:hypothetical protein [Alphaproteobacteria bacterium]